MNAVGLSGASSEGAGNWVYEALLHQRFFPVFSFLFGVSFGLFLDAVQERAQNPRLVMLARLGFLVPFGAVHRVLQPDEVLLTYAVVGIVVLLPASFLSRRVVLMIGVVAEVVAVLVTGGGSVLIPGLFLLGYAAQRYGIERLLSLSGCGFGLGVGGVSLGAIALNGWQVEGGSGFGGRLAGLVTAAAYVGVILVLLRSRARGVLLRLAPAGRMALTNYLGATLMVVAAGQFVRLGTAREAMALGACVFVVEAVFSALWLRHARYGPAEWVWRCLTWWRVVPIRRRGPRPPGVGRPGRGRPPPAPRPP
ncbi:DUF418 domain-containing protein [Actinomadura pelletieri]|uniref:DUF418 domain-containing protein n=1 Tax=Actinomadura pelletieri TaxID=111805 RepID=UPI0011C44E53|nr:DUF418 domain-containing protein [Actinomadura pelletieri]